MESKKKEEILIGIQVLCLCGLLLGAISQKAPQFLQTGLIHDKTKTCVVIDAGHGGIDPGKIAVNGELEKDINLEIAKKVKRYLEAQDVYVVMTRESDDGLYEENDSNKKIVDMKNRLHVIEENHPLLAVSIHQNSYVTEDVSGMQVFYYRDSLSSKEAALCMQEQLIKTLKPEKERVPKENTTYFLLKKTSVPMLIVECGFLSNKKEAQLLATEDYQNRIAWAIHLGILRYIGAF